MPCPRISHPALLVSSGSGFSPVQIRRVPMHHYKCRCFCRRSAGITGSNRTQPKSRTCPHSCAFPLFSGECTYLLLFFCCRKRVEGQSSDMNSLVVVSSSELNTEWGCRQLLIILIDKTKINYFQYEII